MDVTGRLGPPSAAQPDLRSCVLEDVFMDVACGAVRRHEKLTP